MQNSKRLMISKSQTQNITSLKKKQLSNFSNKSSNGPHSEYNHKFKQCRSHIFQLKPIKGSRHGVQPISLKFGHINDVQKPYPVLLKQCLPYGLAPLFGLSIDENIRLKSLSKMKQELELEIAKANEGEYEKQTIMSPKPKHNSCQVCRRQYVDYQIHVKSNDHKKAIQESLGYEYIQYTIEEFRAAIEDENNEDDLQSLFNLALTLEEVIPTIRQHFKTFLIDLNSQRSMPLEQD